MISQVTVNGLDALGEALKNLPDNIAKKYLRQATFAAANVIKEDAIARAPVRSGELQDHIAVFKRSSDADTAHYAIGVRGIKKLSSKQRRTAAMLRKIAGVERLDISGQLFYWRFLEFGTSKMAARPFMRPAFEAQKTTAIDVFRDTLAASVAEAIW